MLAAAVDDANRLVVIAGELTIPLQLLGKTQDSIEGGAEFMAHVGQKLTFSPIRRFCGFFRLLQFTGLLLGLV